MKTRERVLMDTVMARLSEFGVSLIDDGWKPELVVFAPQEIERIPGYKVALVIPLDSVKEPDDERSHP